ncbi:hypothetical protein AWB81_06571 [Caballeronia arationis]|uniref:hypothetical protein n=1 Tax=Caballeronia arationis TaxID=1777142 RepID=UPI00074B511B|nr:hypothetical protein [Caballeronia arationis]SAL04054.1 hypothetical protein AWB81_06571 [Caballeronia arationis]
MRQSIATPNIPPDDTDVDVSAALPTATTDTVARRTAAPPPVSRTTQPDNAGTRTATSIAAYLRDTETPEEVSTPNIADKRVKRTIDRGLVAVVPPNVLRHTIRLRALSLANRFRVIRTIDVAIACFPERPYKAALTAAQRAMRSMTKAKLLLRYRTDRFQHVYGLTEPGARWLDDHGVDAAASVRRVADMSNPEHSLWMHFITLACEVRGLTAHTESEALQYLNRDREPGAPVKQGFITVAARNRKRILRPDVLSYEADGVTWYEIDRSKRGADREASLAALTQRIGGKIATGEVLRRVVVHAKNERIQKRALAILRAQEKASDRPHSLTDRTFREIDEGIFEVWTEIEQRRPDGRIGIENRCVGHVIVQLLPTWLPKVRLDSKNKHPLTGCLSENYLPYRRPDALGTWPRPASLRISANVITDSGLT